MSVCVGKGELRFELVAEMGYTHVNIFDFSVANLSFLSSFIYNIIFSLSFIRVWDIVFSRSIILFVH